MLVRLVAQSCVTTRVEDGMELGSILEQPEGPARTAGLVAWLQGLFREGAEPVLVLVRQVCRRQPTGEEIERWAQRGP